MVDSRTKVLEADSIEAKQVARDDRPFEDIIAALARAVGRLGVTPNALTCASVVPAAGAIVATAMGHFVLAIMLMAFSGLCDLLDGPLARLSGQTTRFGALLDSTLDRFADAAPLIGLSVFYSGYGWISLIPVGALFAAYTVSYIRARAEGLNIRLPPMWMRRTERMLLIGGALLVAPVSFAAIPAPAPLTLAAVALVGLLSLAASIHMLLVAARILRK